MSDIKGGLLDQHRLLRAIIKDERRALSHVMVAAEIIERYWGKFGNGRASVRLLKDVTGLSNQTIIQATRDLTEWGYFERRVGIGTRPTEYIPIWASVLAEQNATTDEPSVLAEQNACVLAEQNANPASVLAEQNETYLQEDGLRPGLPEGRKLNTLGAPSAPLSACLSAADAETPRDPFERFWSAYPRRYQKPKTKAAWNKLAQGDELAERIIIAAGLWAEHYAAHPVDKKWIPAPANWLAGERYDEDLPDVYLDAKQAAIAKKKAGKPTKAKAAPPADNDDEVYPRRELLTISRADVDKDDGTKWLNLNLVDDDGKNHEFTITIEDASADTQAKGQKTLARICDAAGIDDPDELSGMVGKSFVRLLHSKFAEFEYEPMPPAMTEREFWGPNTDFDWRPPERPPRPLIRSFIDRVRMSPFTAEEAADTDARAKAYAAKCAEEDEEAA